jgi:hypothetical protein
MSRSSIYRRIKLFRRVFGMHPDDYEFPGVTIDLDATCVARRATERHRVPELGLARYSLTHGTTAM